ncbi:MAG: hypothetical protein DDT25_00253 [Chloroflexi bacterium]|nr:hypothetical protein [Chloroflexota bacterium]
MKSKAQSGYTVLLALLFAAAGAASLFALWSAFTQRQAQAAVAEIEGMALAQFGVGLRGIVAAIQANPALLPAGPQMGVAWLRPPDCGGFATNPPEGFVPCSFTGGSFGRLYETTFTRNAATNFITARTGFVVPIFAGDPLTRPILAEQLSAAALRQQAAPLNGMFYQVFANVPLAAVDDGNKAIAPGINAGRVVMLAQNAPSNDLWLRTDGTNRMLADLNVGGNSLVNVNNADLAGDIDIDGRARVRGGLQVTSGLVQAEQGIQTTDVMLTGINRTASQAIYDADVLVGSASYIVPKPDCTTVGTQPAIYASIQSSGTPPLNPSSPGVPSDALYNTEIRVTDMGASWLVEPVSIGVSHGLQLSGFDLSLIRTYSQAQSPTMSVVVLRKCR